MRRIKWTKTEISSLEKNCFYLKDIIEGAEDQFWKSGDVVCEVYLNGKALTQEEEDRLSLLEIGKINDLEFLVSSEKELFQKNILTLKKGVHLLIQYCESFVEGVYKGHTEGSQKSFLELVQQLEVIFDNIRVLKPKFKDVEDITEKWACVEEKSKNIVISLIDSFEKKNIQNTSDIVDYDLLENLDNWLEILCLKDNIEG